MRYRKWHSAMLSALVGWLPTTACADLVNSPGLPAGVSDPKTYYTEHGSLGFYRSVVAGFEGGRVAYAGNTGNLTSSPSAGSGAYWGAASLGGVLTDELRPAAFGGASLAYLGDYVSVFQVDARELPEVGAGNFEEVVEGRATYIELHTVRVQAGLAIQMLRKYAPDAPPALQGHLYALAAYSELFLADLFCSGIPLSTLELDKDYIYRPGLRTSEIYWHASALFDSALAISQDSARIMHLARIGKGRALLALGRYREAADAVLAVPLTYTYDVIMNWNQAFENWGANPGDGVSVADRDGSTGEPYVNSGDPRTAADSAGANRFGAPWYFPRKFGNKNATSKMSVASGIEAQLIRAESELQEDRVSEWLTILNQLRTQANDPRLPPLDDPGVGPIPQGTTPADVRRSLMFRERAAWLFLTGHRQGDLRRLIRQYRRSVREVYPTGTYPIQTLFPRYSDNVTLPIPESEKVNRYSVGSFDRAA